MTKKASPGDCAVVVVYDGSEVVVFLAVVDFDVLFVVVVLGDAADAEPATSTAAVTPSENIMKVIATPATALRRGGGFLTTDLR
jgi:hypothetical protein